MMRNSIHRIFVWTRIIALCLVGLLSLPAFAADSAPPAPPPIGPEQLVGKWEGVIAAYTGILHDRANIIAVEISDSRGALSGRILAMAGLKAEEEEGVLGGRMPPEVGAVYVRRGVYEQDLSIAFEGSRVLLSGGPSRSLFAEGRGTSPLPAIELRLALARPGFLLGETAAGVPCWLERRDVSASAFPAVPGRGRTMRIESSVFPGLAYSCRVPASYDPSKGAPLLVFSLPGADAEPLSVRAAEELGWISVGMLKKSQDAARVIIDAKTRFNVGRREIFLAGFSRTAGQADGDAETLGLFCGGVICMGNWASSAAGTGIPCFYIFGDRDYLPEDMPIEERGTTYRDFRKYFDEILKPDYGSLIELRQFPGGHGWGVPALHEEAMRWLARATR